MDASGDGFWLQTFWPERPEIGRRHRALLEEAEAAQRTSADRLRAMGKTDLARRAERFAARIRFDLDHPRTAQRIHAMAADLRHVPQQGLLLDRALSWALSLLRAERGNIQLRDPLTGSLRIAVQHGFGAEFLAHFASVDDDGSACGRAAQWRAQAVIRDVRTDPGFAPHRAIAAASGFRAVQSTPVIAPSGRVLGVISTHYPRPGGPSGLDLAVARRLGELLGEMLSRGTPDGHVAAGDRAGQGGQHSPVTRLSRRPHPG